MCFEARQPLEPRLATLHNISYRTLLSSREAHDARSPVSSPPARGTVSRRAPDRSRRGEAPGRPWAQRLPCRLPLRELDLAGFELLDDLAKCLDQLGPLDTGFLEGKVQLEGATLRLIDEGEAAGRPSAGLLFLVGSKIVSRGAGGHPPDRRPHEVRVPQPGDLQED